MKVFGCWSCVFFLFCFLAKKNTATEHQRAEKSLSLILVEYQNLLAKRQIPNQMLCFSPAQETCRSCLVKTTSNGTDCCTGRGGSQIDLDQKGGHHFISNERNP